MSIIPLTNFQRPRFARQLLLIKNSVVLTFCNWKLNFETMPSLTYLLEFKEMFIYIIGHFVANNFEVNRDIIG